MTKLGDLTVINVDGTRINYGMMSSASLPVFYVQKINLTLCLMPV